MGEKKTHLEIEGDMIPEMNRGAERSLEMDLMAEIFISLQAIEMKRLKATQVHPTILLRNQIDFLTSVRLDFP